MHGFLSKFSPNGKKLLFSTFFGSSLMEEIGGLAIDDKDNIYIMGGTFTADLPVTDNAIRKGMMLPKVQGEIDHYIAKINATDNKISYLSYFAGRGFSISSIKWTKPNRLMVCASAMEEGMPVTDNVISKKGEGSIIPISQNVFVPKGIDDVQLIFNKNEAGEVESLTLQQNGMDYICKKLVD